MSLRGPERAVAISTADKSRLLRRKLLAMTEKPGLQSVNGYGKIYWAGFAKLIINKERDSAMEWVRTIAMLILLLIWVGPAGCFSSNAADIEAFLKPYEANVTVENYVLQPPDEIEIHCSGVPELHLQRQQIRPDGRIAFERLGQLEAAGKTPQQVADMLTQKVSQLYKLTGNNPVDVRVVAFKSKVYYVVGQVYFPGAKDYTGRDTLLGALADAQPTVLGWAERVQVIRPPADENADAKIFEVNYDRMIAHGDTSKNVLLQEGDIIYVPPTVLAAAAMKVEEVVRPIGRAFSTVNIVQGAPAR